MFDRHANVIRVSTRYVACLLFITSSQRPTGTNSVLEVLYEYALYKFTLLQLLLLPL